MIAIDSNVFIYMLNGHREFGELARTIFVAAEQTTLEICASELTFMEVLSFQHLDDTAASKVEKSLGLLGVRFVPVSTKVMLDAAKLRRQAGLGALDAIHVASAILQGCTHFVTNDRQLLKCKVPGIKLLSLEHFDQGALQSVD